jgi:hypothetical protein
MVLVGVVKLLLPATIAKVNFHFPAVAPFDL